MIGVSKLFKESLLKFKERYKANLPTLFQAILPFYIVLSMVLYYSYKGLKLAKSMNTSEISFIEDFTSAMTFEIIITWGLGLFSMIYVFALYLPATHGAFVAALYPNVKGKFVLKNTFKTYFKPFAHMFLYYLPGAVIFYVIVMIFNLAFAISYSIVTDSGFTQNISGFTLGFFYLSALAINLGASISSACTAQMIPLTLRENVPIIRTYKLSIRRGRSAILSHVIVKFLYNLPFIILTGVAFWNSLERPEVFLAAAYVLLAASFFLKPFHFALCAATYKLCQQEK